MNGFLTITASRFVLIGRITNPAELAGIYLFFEFLLFGLFTPPG